MTKEQWQTVGCGTGMMTLLIVCGMLVVFGMEARNELRTAQRLQTLVSQEVREALTRLQSVGEAQRQMMSQTTEEFSAHYVALQDELHRFYRAHPSPPRWARICNAVV